MDIIDYINSKLDSSGKTNRQISDETGLAWSTVQEFRSKKGVKPNAVTLNKMAKAAGIEPSEMRNLLETEQR